MEKCCQFTIFSKTAPSRSSSFNEEWHNLGELHRFLAIRKAGYVFPFTSGSPLYFTWRSNPANGKQTRCSQLNRLIESYSRLSKG
jgi:hypothetical protein